MFRTNGIVLELAHAWGDVVGVGGVHLSEGEQLTIICSATFLGRRSLVLKPGREAVLPAAANRLADAELAYSVVISRAPSHWNRPGAFDEIAVPRDRLWRTHVLASPFLTDARGVPVTHT
jgi:hypothetical protein